ncbi:MAG TPA: hypothetical protein VFP20_06925 [Bacteroidales bacterium]|nr:hypothetical protein [Bacteroidales bacterium]
MKLHHILPILTLTLITFHPAAAQSTPQSDDVFNYYMHQDSIHPLAVNPRKWAEQPNVNSWETMETSYDTAQIDRNGYRIYQLAYLEYVHNYTHSKLNPKTMLYRAFEIGKENGDPYLMYWVTHLEGTVFFRFEYLERRRHHAEWTDSVATEKEEWPVLYLLAKLNTESFDEMKSLASQYLQCAYLKDETYGLLPYDVLRKAQEMEKKTSKK